MIYVKVLLYIVIFLLVCAMIIQSKQSTSIMTNGYFAGKLIHFKRDDLLLNCMVSGNKARKFEFLCSQPRLPSRICSYGGIQSNAMSAIANIVFSRKSKSKFLYFTRKIPSWLKNNPIGNQNSTRI